MGSKRGIIGWLIIGLWKAIQYLWLLQDITDCNSFLRIPKAICEPSSPYMVPRFSVISAIIAIHVPVISLRDIASLL